ncbi:hypothetical protein quinque_000591 [Culex quinquefasciatus]
MCGAVGLAPTKYHYYPHNQHIYFLPECAIQQVCNAVYVRLNYTQPLCACPPRPCTVGKKEPCGEVCPSGSVTSSRHAAHLSGSAWLGGGHGGHFSGVAAGTGRKVGNTARLAGECNHDEV